MEVIPSVVISPEENFDDILAKDLRQLSVEDKTVEDATKNQQLKSAINQSTISSATSKSSATSNKFKTNFFKMLSVLKAPTTTTPEPSPCPSPAPSPMPTPILPSKATRRQSSTGDVSKRRKSLYTDLASTDDNVHRVTLPRTFRIKYMGRRPVDALWGVKHTRKVVDWLLARRRASGRRSPALLLTVSEEGVTLQNTEATLADPECSVVHFPIDMVSYGVQDYVYTKIFSLITVCHTSDQLNDDEHEGPFTCFVFYCDTNEQVVEVTAALAQAFKRYTRLLEQPEPRHIPLNVIDGDGHSEV